MSLDRIADGVDGRRESPSENGSAISAHVLAPWAKCSHINELARRTYEHGGTVAPTN